VRGAAKLALGAAAGAAYLWAMSRRNRRLARRRPPIRDQDGAPLPEREFRYSDGVSVSCVDAGEGPPVVLVPGADGIKETFRYQVPSFSERYRVISADLRGEFPADATFDRFADDLLELTERLGTGPVLLLGQSLGGAIAMRFAARHPERVRGLVLCNTLTRVSYEHVGLNRTALTPLAMATTRYLPTPLARLAADLWCRERVWIFEDSPGCEKVVEYALHTGPRTVPPRTSARRVGLLKGLDLRPELAGIGAPTLVVKGSEDRYTPPAWCREIAALIPDARYVEVPGTGHVSHVSSPGRFNRLVLDWLASVGLGPEVRGNGADIGGEGGGDGAGGGGRRPGAPPAAEGEKT